jgi:FkbM family methyltransferase
LEKITNQSSYKISFKDYLKPLLYTIAKNSCYKFFLRLMTRAGFLPEWVWKRLPYAGTFRVSLPDGASFLYAAIASEGLGRVLFWGGIESYEFETIKVFYDLAKKSNLVLDIGAYTGIFSLVACVANPYSRVISFEPVPHVTERLKANIKLNGWEDRCQIREEAVSNVAGVGKFHVSRDYPDISSLNIEGFRGSEGYLIDVPMIPLDALCPTGQRVDLVKIDVEGFEDQVLQGMNRVIGESAPVIIIECLPDGPYLAIERILGRVGYRFFHLLEEGAMLVDRIVPDKNEKYRNFLCVGHDKWDWLM